MALIDKLNNIGDAIRQKTGKTELLTLEQMAEEIRSIEGGAGGSGKFASLVDKSITEVTAEDLKGATQIGYCAFHSCFSLSSITIPETVTYIASGAFSFCDALTQLTIPSAVTSIGSGALDFAALQNRTIRMLPDEPPSIPSDFTNIMYPKTYIVNKGRGDVYKSATNWSDLAERIVEVEE